MKKLIATLLAIVMLAALSVCAFAANNFTQSPTKPDAPQVEIVGNVIDTQQATSTDIQQLNIDITNHVVVLKATAYNNRNTINLPVSGEAGSKTAKVILEEAKQKLASATSIHDLVAGVSPDAKVTEVLDISLIKTDALTNTQSIVNLPPNARITINLTRSIPNFEALLHYKEITHQWEKVEGATLVNDTLSFPVDSLSPFAIVVKNTSSGPSSPATGASAPIACAVGAVVFGVVGVALLKKSKEN